ncbi:MAG: menaquinol oxidoreductase [Desulfuromonadales bacterium]|nr:menaquinol oxidoreductase [Desulfuromonadales bacterium]
MQSEQHGPAKEMTDQHDNREQLRLGILNDIKLLQRRSLVGAWALSLFLLLSAFAWWSFPLFPSPETMIAQLGSPPTPPIISIAFLTYTFFAIILSLSRMMSAIEHYGIFSHIGFLAGFYFFYHVAGALDDNYWAVFAAGITILVVEGYRIRQLCLEGIIRNRERLAYLEKTGRLPVDE